MASLDEPVECLDSTWLQVQAPPIVIGDNLALSGSAFNPIVIHLMRIQLMIIQTGAVPTMTLRS